MTTVIEHPLARAAPSAGAPPVLAGRTGVAALPAENPWIIAISVMLATFMEVLDTTIASVALPYIAGSMAASNSEATWVLTTYLIANAAVLPASNWFGLRFGRKRFLIACVTLFAVASFLCGSAPSLPFLLLARVMQGAGGGALQPISQAILLESFPPRKRGAAMAVFGFGVVVAPVLGPTMGGWLTDAYSWRYAFYINIPIGLLAVLMISRFVHDPSYIHRDKAGRFDGVGFGLLCLWTGSLQIILDRGQEDDWFGAVWIRWAALLLAVSLVWFVRHSWRAKTPLVDLRVMQRNWNFGVSCLLIFLLGFALYIQVSILPLFYQEVLGYTALTAGIVVAPRGFGAMMGLPLVGYVSQRLDNRWLLFLGFCIFTVSSLVFSFVNLSIGPLTLLLPIVAAGFGMSFLFVPLGNLGTGALRNEEMGNATGIFNLLRNIGGSVGIAIAQTELIRRAGFHQARLVAHAAPSDTWFQIAAERLGDYLGMHLGSAAGAPAAFAMLYRHLQQQALLLAFIDIFRWTALVTAVAALLGWLFRKMVVRAGTGME